MGRVPAGSLAELLRPFWASRVMHGEPLFFHRREGEDRELPWARLLFPPEECLRLESSDGQVVYQADRDYVLEGDVVRLTRESRIAFKTRAEMYPPADSALPSYPHLRGDPGTHLIFGESGLFHRLQVAVTYTHADGGWHGPVPAYAGASLERTAARLRAGKKLKLWVSGDSISVGGDVSGFMKLPPLLPPFPELVALGLEAACDAEVALEKCAGGGWTSGDGLERAGEVADVRPDLAFIAYGMNDCDEENPSLLANVQGIMSAVRASNPEAEFVLVAPMLPNPEWHFPRMENFPAFRESLAGLCGPGVALADVTSTWAELLKRKSFHDLTGNGVNHPNDFGHRVYAQVILSLLLPPEKLPRAGGEA